MSLLKKIEERKKQQEMLTKKKNVKIATTGAALGAITGVFAGIILAPKSGKETIEELKDGSKKIKDKFERQAEDTKIKINESKTKIKNYLKDKKNLNKATEEELIENEQLKLVDSSQERKSTEINESKED